MALSENKSKALDAALQQIEKLFGRGSVMKLGQKAINYATDKFHNLFSSTQSANKTTLPNPHNW